MNSYLTRFCFFFFSHYSVLWISPRRRGPFSFFIRKSNDFRNNQIIKCEMNNTVYLKMRVFATEFRDEKLTMMGFDASDGITNLRIATHRRRKSK